MLRLHIWDAVRRALVSEKKCSSELNEWVDNLHLNAPNFATGPNDVRSKRHFSFPLGSLPNDLQWRVLRSADLHKGQGTKTRHQLGLVCKGWQKLLSETSFWQETEFNTCDFVSSRSLVQALLRCVEKAGTREPRIRLVQRMPHETRGIVLYGDKRRLEMFRGAPAGFSAEDRELERWLRNSLELGGSVMEQQWENPAWRLHMEAFDDVMRGKEFRPRALPVRRKTNNVVTAVCYTLIGMGSGLVIVLLWVLFAILLLNWNVWWPLLMGAIGVAYIL